MSDLEVVSVAREQPPGHQRLDDLLRERRLDADEGELGDGDASRAQRPLVVLLGEPDQQPASGLLALVRRATRTPSRRSVPTAPVTPPVAEVARQCERSRPDVAPRSPRALWTAAAARPYGPARRARRRRSGLARPSARPSAAGSSTTCRSSVSVSGGTSTRAPCRCSATSGCSASRPTWSPRTTSTHRATTSSASRPSSGVQEGGPFALGDVCRPQLLELVAHEHDRRRRRLLGGEAGEAVDGTRSGHDDHRLPPCAAAAARRTAARAAGRPAPPTTCPRRWSRTRPAAGGRPARSPVRAPSGRVRGTPLRRLTS